MSKDHICRLTTGDYAVLETMLALREGPDPLATLLRRKLSQAIVMFRDDIPNDVVTLNSRVTYRIDGASAETRIVALDQTRGTVGSVLSISTPRGLALLGLSEGQSVAIASPQGGVETICVEAVVYQPESAERESKRLASPATAERQPMRPSLRVVEGSGPTIEFPPRARPMPSVGGFDDPGPSAA